MNDALADFSPPVATWFRQTFGRPTPPQAAGWPPIQRGEHTLILAPTGSGKTIAAFLWGIDQICRGLAASHDQGQAQGRKRSTHANADAGVQLIYISPLKALNNDIERNLRAPLEGIRSTAASLGEQWPALRVAVRTGDTPGHVRAQMVKRPPHILITTPESLYLILTSPRARDMLRTVHTVIVDEIHTLCGNKRGVHLSVTLERLEHLVAEANRRRPAETELAGERATLVQRIGLSATQRPLEEVARFLGGQQWSGANGHAPGLEARPVTIVDTGYRKPLDLRVVTAVEDFGEMPGNTIWPSVVARVLGDIRRHRSTLVFANNRRLAERTADRLNAQLAAEQAEEIPPGSTEALAPGGIVRDRGMFALGAEGPIRAHHGSMSKEARRQMEEELKAGRLPALVGTSSLELGIDIGSVDLVVQLQSPKSVAQGLQRVGRSGHLVGQTSTGRIYPTFREDLVEAAAIAHGMLEGAIEETYTPQNTLDVLSQQIVAAVAVEEWSAHDLYNLVCQAYAYHNLGRRAFDSVLDMLSGRYYQAMFGPAAPAEAAGQAGERPAGQPGGTAFTALRARISWDRVNDRLAALPGSRLLAVSNAGTIPDTGAYGVYLADGQTRVGELDEEFVFETRPGDAFLFGSQVWRVLEIKDDRLIVSPAPDTVPRMPFWHGDYPWRPYELGVRIGEFRGQIAERVGAGREEEKDGAEPAGEARHESGPGGRDLERWLAEQYALDANSVRNLVGHVRQQLDALGIMSSDTAIVAEYFRDAVGEQRLVLHSPFGGRVNGAWAMAIRNALRERLGTEPELMASDDGIIFRFPETTAPPPIDVITRMTPAEARERILQELPNSALFGAQFRMAAGRALLLPRARGQRRTPFWLQRLKAKDLLAIVRRFGDFPVVAEAYRTALEDVLDVVHLEQVLAGIQGGTIRVVPIETAVPSPIAGALLSYFINTYIYEWDAPKAERNLQALTLHREVLSGLLAERDDLSELLRPEIVQAVTAELQHSAAGYQARSAEELAAYMGELGDRTREEIVAMCLRSGEAEDDGAFWLRELAAAGRVVQLPGLRGLPAAERWATAELAGEYRMVLAGRPGPAEIENDDAWRQAAATALRRFLRHAGPVTRDAIARRYDLPGDWLAETLEKLDTERVVARGYFTVPPVEGAGTADGEARQFCDMDVLEQIQRRTLAALRREVQSVSLPDYAAFLTRWQHVHPANHLAGDAGLRQAMGQLRGLSLPGNLWEDEILPARMPDFAAGALANLCASGELVWTGAGSDPRHLRVRFFFRGEGRLFLAEAGEPALSPDARAVYDYLKSEGASFLADLQAGLGRRRETLATALAELVVAGLATNDNLAALHAVVAAGMAAEQVQASPRPPLSALEAELAERLAGKSRPLTHTRYNEARRHARRRVAGILHPGQPPAATGAAPGVRPSSAQPGDLAAGRWSLVHRAAVLGPTLDAEERALRQAQILLARYGVVARDLLAHEDLPGDWSQIYAQLQRLEMRGQLRRGYFIAGLAGSQFALPEAVELLRATAAQNDDALTVLSAVDPANVYGGDLRPDEEGQAGPRPGVGVPAAAANRGQGDVLRFARIPSTDLVLWRGRPVLVAEDRGARLSAAEGVKHEILVVALEAYLARRAPRHLVVAQWNGGPVWGSDGEALLKSLGFYRSPAGMERWD